MLHVIGSAAGVHVFMSQAQAFFAVQAVLLQSGWHGGGGGGGVRLLLRREEEEGGGERDFFDGPLENCERSSRSNE